MSESLTRRLLLVIGTTLCSLNTLVLAQDFPISTSPTNVGYIDSATIGNRFRVRFDAGYGLSPADRAEFFYASTGVPAGNVDYQEFSSYLEVARTDWLSGFIEAPLKFINPDLVQNTSGVGDINVGFKAVLLAAQRSCTTFQFRTYLPTGDDSRRLGTGNVNVEPALLNYFRLDDRWTMESEFRTWVPVTSAAFPGTILRYGTGISYNSRSGCSCQPSFSPVLEIVGWTVLDGLATMPDGSARSASGDTIVNAKFGVRASFKGDQLYAGFGQALTAQHWYEQIFRVEYRFQF